MKHNTQDETNTSPPKKKHLQNPKQATTSDVDEQQLINRIVRMNQRSYAYAPAIRDKFFGLIMLLI